MAAYRFFFPLAQYPKSGPNRLGVRFLDHTQTHTPDRTPVNE